MRSFTVVQDHKAYMKTLPKNSGLAVRRKPGIAGEVAQPGPNSRQAKYVLRLYVSGSTSKSALAIENIKQICERHLKSRYNLKVVDIYQQPNLARDEQIVAVPTLIKRFPPPLRRLIGDLSNTDKVLFQLDLGMPPCKTNTDNPFSPRPTKESSWGRYTGSA